MDSFLLSTKINPPPVKTNPVGRQHLLDVLDSGLNPGCKLILVSAPPGYGKTTLVSLWTSNRSFPLGWVSLDVGDNDLARFLTYLAAALENIVPGAVDLVRNYYQVSNPKSVEAAMVVLLNELAEVNEPHVLVLDDYHLITDQAVHNCLDFFLEHASPHTHLLLASRADPPLPLARLRARSQLLELRLADLKFSLDEVKVFIEQSAKLELSENQILALSNRTEGWAAGLQMAVLAVQAQPVQENVGSFIAAFTGSDRYILDYLVEEVLDHQPAHIQEFLLKTSILNRLDGRLCQALLSEARIEKAAEAAGSQELLDWLERSNLFVIPLDHERRWFRYHQLFADLLRRRLRQVYPDLILQLHQRASLAYEQLGRLEDAIEHALAAGDAHRAAVLIEQVVESLLIRGEMTTFLRWMHVLPQEVLLDRPLMGLYSVFIQVVSGVMDETASSHLKQLENVDHSSQFRGEFAAIRAVQAVYLGSIQTCEVELKQALEYLPPERSFLRSYMDVIQGVLYLWQGQDDQAARVFERTIRESQQSGNILFAVIGLRRLSRLYISHGKLHRAERMLQQIMQISQDSRGRPLPLAGMALAGLGELKLERNELDEAERLFKKGLQLTTRFSEMRTIDVYLSLARVYSARREFKQAGLMLDLADQLARMTESTDLDDIGVRMGRVRLGFAEQDFSLARQWIRELDLDKPFSEDDIQILLKPQDEFLEYHLRRYYLLLLARLRLAEEQPEQVLQIVKPLLTKFEGENRLTWVVECLLVLALAYKNLGNSIQSLQCLDKALEIAEPEGYVRIFLDEGDPMLGLLEQSARNGSRYAQHLVVAAGKKMGPSPPASRALQHKLIEPLTDRELEVLYLLPTHLTTPEIAERLIIAVSTVRTHIKNIYGKLGVHDRDGAVQRAHEIGLLTMGLEK